MPVQLCRDKYINQAVKSQNETEHYKEITLGQEILLQQKHQVIQ